MSATTAVAFRLSAMKSSHSRVWNTTRASNAASACHGTSPRSNRWNLIIVANGAGSASRRPAEQFLGEPTVLERPALRARNCHVLTLSANIIEQCRDGDEPSVFLTQPAHQLFESRLQFAVVHVPM